MGELFGLSGNEIEALVTSVICDEWKIKYDGGYASDPRKELYEKIQQYAENLSFPLFLSNAGTIQFLFIISCTHGGGSPTVKRTISQGGQV